MALVSIVIPKWQYHSALLLTLHMYVSTTIDNGILTRIFNCQHTMPINIEYLCVVKFVNCSVGRDRVGRFVTTGMNYCQRILLTLLRMRCSY